MKTLLSKIRVKTLQGYEQHQVFNVDDFPYEYFSFTKFKIFKKWKNKQVYEYLDLIATFDTENTSYYIPSEDTWNAFTYLWGFCIDGFLIVGRTYEQFILFIKRIANVLNLGKRRLIIYVHNLSYDFAFFSKFMMQLDSNYDLFAIDSRKLLTFTAFGIEFRCSYKLFNMSLEKACINEKGCKYRKAKGDLNYKKFRMPTGKYSGLTNKEWNYFILDLLALYDLIKNKLANEGRTLKNIPLTSTGFIRELMRKNCIGYGSNKKTLEQREYIKLFKKLELSEEVYNMLQWNIAGGDTHGNRKFISMIMEDCDSGDLQSSYPAVMLLSSEFALTSYMAYGKPKNRKHFEVILKQYACLFYINFKHIRIKDDNPYDCISVSKICNLLSDAQVDIIDNGRLIEGRNITLCLNQLDYWLIKKNYDFDFKDEKETGFRVHNLQIARKGQLPKPIRDTVLFLFKQKCQLKLDIKKFEKECKANNIKYEDLPEYENLVYKYNKYKGLINSTFGMMLTNPVRDKIIINENGEWDVKKVNTAEELEKYYKSRKSFLHYAWGAIVTSAARTALDNMRRACTGKNGVALYWDTDSCKGFNFDFDSINKYNDKIRKECIKNDCLVTIDDIEFVIGAIEIETEGDKHYKKFCTLGSKKYAYVDGDGLHITISGVKKKEGAKELGTIEHFIDGIYEGEKGFTFKSAGQTAQYNDENIHYLYLEGEKILTASNVALYDTTYTLNAPDNWLDFSLGGEFIYD